MLKIDLTLAVGGVSETVKVTAESPLIDVKQNAAGANVQSEIIERIPKGRDFAAARHLGAGHHQRSRATAASRSTAPAAPTTGS